MWWAGSFVSTPLAWIMKRQKQRKSWDVITQNTAVKRTCRGTFFTLLTLITAISGTLRLEILCNLQTHLEVSPFQIIQSIPFLYHSIQTSWNAIGRIRSRRQLKKHYCNHCKNGRHSVSQPGAMFTVISRARGQPAVLWCIRHVLCLLCHVMCLDFVPRNDRALLTGSPHNLFV